MNCHDAYLWMLETEEPADVPPDPIAEHLRDCNKCRQRQKRVLRILTAVQQLPPPPEHPAVRADTLVLVRQAAAAQTSVRDSPWLWHALLLAVAAIFLLGLLAWLAMSGG